MKIFNENTYRPLPMGLTIKQSSVDGLGLHATTNLNAGTVLGETHVLVHNRDRHEWVRTPLGGFINHSDNPNIKWDYNKLGDIVFISKKLILPGQQLFIDYGKKYWENRKDKF